nr:hypothetical protein [Sphingopyxis sp. GW247-27LB]
MIGHDQEAAVEHTLLAGEHGRHRRLHIIVDTASRHTAEERERPGMGIEQHLLPLARIGPNIGCARGAEAHMRHLHPHRLAGDLHILVAPVELVGLSRLEGHRDERRCAFASILPPRSTPARRIAAHRIIGSIEPLARQQVMNTRHP